MDAVPRGGAGLAVVAPGGGVDQMRAVVVGAVLVEMGVAVEKSSSSYDVTLVTHTTTEKLWLLDRLCDRWRGPMSLALWLNATEAASRSLWTERTRALASGCGSSSFSIETAEAESADAPYPVNRLRNMAVRRVSTSHVLVSDMDFMPSAGLRSAAIRELQRTSDEWTALIVPAFQRKGGNCKTVEACRRRVEPLDATIPRTFDGLVECLEADECIAFQSDNSPASHGTTDYAAWLAQDAPRPIRCFASKRYEPYVVVAMSVAPPYDERFTGYGKNKIQHVAHLRRLGLKFSVLHRHFLCHVPHPRSASKSQWIHSFRVHKAVDELYDTFLRELDAAIAAPPAVPVCGEERRDRLRRSRRQKGDPSAGFDLHDVAQRLNLPIDTSDTNRYKQLRAASSSLRSSSRLGGGGGARQSPKASLDTRSHGDDDRDDGRRATHNGWQS